MVFLCLLINDLRIKLNDKYENNKTNRFRIPWTQNWK